MGTDPIFRCSAQPAGKWGLSLFFEDCCDSHPACGADRDQPAARAAVGELLREPGDDARAGGAERMADGDAAALRVHLRAIDRAQRLRAFEAGAAGLPRLPGPPRAEDLLRRGVFALVDGQTLRTAVRAPARSLPPAC